MDTTDALVKGGVSIAHSLSEGKHQYEVNDVVKFRKGSGKGAFARKGDKLLQINGMDLENLVPEEFAQMLSKGNSMLTVHQAHEEKWQTDQTGPEGKEGGAGAFRPESKERTLLSFSLQMRTEEELEEEWRREEGEGEGGGGGGEEEEELCPIGPGEVEGQRGDLLVVAFNRTSISVVRGRGCGAGSACPDCGGVGCNFNEVVLVSESSTVTLVPRGTGNFKQIKQRDNVSLENSVSQMYLRTTCAQNLPYMAANPEKMTIYYYTPESTEEFRGLPVVLNFSDSNCFLKCYKEGEQVRLRVETCEKQKLKLIYRTDESSLSFVFYMKSHRTQQRLFESALCKGWFIRNANASAVNAAVRQSGQEDDPSFFFIIQK